MLMGCEMPYLISRESSTVNKEILDIRFSILADTLVDPKIQTLIEHPGSSIEHLIAKLWEIEHATMAAGL